MNIKEPPQLERDILQNSSGSFPVIVLDTGGLIDIVASMRQYSIVHKNNGRDPRYEKTTSFLRHLSEKAPIIITPKTYTEMHQHGRIKLNDHALEIGPKTVDFALETMIRSMEFISGLEHQIELDQVRYDAHWAAIYGCNSNHKKDLEGCSDTDREILSTVALLSTSQIHGATKKEIDPILVISSDAHIIQGSEFLKRGFDERYSGIVPISTRY